MLDVVQRRAIRLIGDPALNLPPPAAFSPACYW
nr:unnamed protein product [Callosobruchus chinensis]